MVDVANSLTSALGISSGINTTQLVSDLANATYGPKIDNTASLQSSNAARISALASAKSSLQTFSDALTKLLQSSTYSGQPVSNDTSIASVTATGGGNITGLPAQIEVQQLASAQVLQSTPLGTAATSAGQGTMTLTVGTSTYDITLDASSNTLADLASKINDAKSGVTASVVTDQSGARLVLKGETGAAKSFTLTSKLDDNGDPMTDADLQRFTFPSEVSANGMTRSQEAKNAKVKIDNVAMEFDKNETTTAIPNLRIDFNRAVPGTSVTLATDQPTSSMNDLVKEIVDAYNTLKSSLNTATRNSDGAGSSSGLLSNDPGVRIMSQSLARLTSTQLTPDGTYKTLADLGISTNRDGTLTLDSTKLTKALAADPEGVVKMLNPTAPDATHIGIGGALKSITDYLNADKGPLSASASTYDKLATNYAKDITKFNEQKSTYSEQLSKSYATMQSRLLAFKSTQSYLEQQITAWNK